jgi:hypothetical protein
VGQTPIYDWLRGERINADVPPSRVDQHGHSGRHCLDEHMPGAVAVVVRPSGPAADGLTGHLRRGWISADARRAGEELGLAGRGPLAQPLLRKPPREQRHHRLAIPRRTRPMIFSQCPRLWWATRLAGTGQWRQRVPRRAPRHALRPRERRCFRGLGRENCVTGSLADKPWCGVAGLLVGVGAETPAKTAVRGGPEVTRCR